MFFDELNESELVKLENIGVLKTYTPNVTIIAEGSHGTSFGLIIAGEVEVQKVLENGQRQPIVRLGPTDIIGELGFLGLRSRSATVVALTDCDILEYDHQQFEHLVTIYPEIGMKIYKGIAKELAQRLAQSDQHLMEQIGWALNAAPKE